jgi:hypothetical protein
VGGTVHQPTLCELWRVGDYYKLENNTNYGRPQSS